jgi:hypothetical protein
VEEFIILLIVVAAVVMWFRISRIRNQMANLRSEIYRLNSRIWDLSEQLREARRGESLAQEVGPAKPPIPQMRESKPPVEKSKPAQSPPPPPVPPTPERARAAGVMGFIEKTRDRDGVETAQTTESVVPEQAPVASSGGNAGLDFEARVGGPWALRVGLVLLAIGIAFFARLITPYLGPAEKVALAYAGTLILFGVGKLFERKLQNFARPVMAGGLALGFFVSYASYFVPAMRCVPLAGAFVWMLAGVGALFFFADRWKSQPTAGLAIFLGHVSAFVAAGEVDAFSLIVIVFLSASAVVLFLRHDWLPLSLFAVVAAFSSHALWVSIEHVETTPEQSFWINLAFLSSYYFIFQASDLIWWRRVASRRADAFSLAQRNIGRVLGPTNLLLYVALVSFLYVGTEVFLDEIHWFFFAVAAVQGLLGIALRTFGNEDYVFYPAVGIILATIGCFSAFEALTLNLVLACEALILLLAAHRTRIWIFHLLAQVMLAINFTHYWAYTIGEASTLSYFLGGLTTAAVYFAKSALEEAWYGGDRKLQWTGVADQGAISKPLSEAFDAVYSPIAPYFAHIHAAAGAIILVNQCARHFSDRETAVLVLSLLVFVPALVGLVRRSVPLLVGYLFMQAGLACFALMIMPQKDGLVPWLGWWVVASGLIVSTVTVAAMQWRMRDSKKAGEGIAISHLALWCSVVVAFSYLVFGQENTSLHFAWIAAVALIYVHLDRMRAGFLKIREERGLPGQDFPAHVFGAIAASLLIIGFTWQSVADDVAVLAWLALWGALVIFAGGIRRNLGFYVSGLIVLSSCYLFMFSYRSLAIDVMDNTMVSLWIVAITLAIAWVKDLLFVILGDSLTDYRKAWAEALTTFQYALGLLFLTALLYHRIVFPWSIVAVSACSIALYLLCTPLRMQRGVNASFALVLIAHLLGFVRFAGMRALPDEFLIAVFAFFVAGIAFERALTLGQGLVFDSDGKAIRTIMLGDRSLDATHVARGTIIAAAAGVIVLAIYRSALLGAEWTTAGWSLAGATLVGLGFAWRSSSYRWAALGIFTLCLARVFLVDTRHLSDVYKTLAFITLGLCLMAMAWLYSRFASNIRKWL